MNDHLIPAERATVMDNSIGYERARYRDYITTRKQAIPGDNVKLQERAKITDHLIREERATRLDYLL